MQLLSTLCCLWLPAQRALALKIPGPEAAPVGAQLGSKRNGEGMLTWRDVGLGMHGLAHTGYWERTDEAIWAESDGGITVEPDPGLPAVSAPCNDMDVFGNLSFTLTEAMCGKTRPHRSNSPTIKTVMSKLRQKQCLKLVALGGSVTFGNCMNCPPTMRIPKRLKVTWPAQLSKWLNVKFPCGGDGHKVWNLGTPAVDSDFWHTEVANWRDNKADHPILQADVVFVDTAINDMQDTFDQIPMTWVTETQRPKIEMHTESLVRVLRTLPQKPWLVWAEVAWGYWHPRTGGPGHGDAEVAHTPVLQYYDVDQVSLIDAILPLSNDPRREWIGDFLYVDDCHPNVLGHQMSANVMGHAFETEFQDATAMKKSEDGGFWESLEEQDPALPPPMFIDPVKADLFEGGSRVLKFSASNQWLLDGAWKMDGFFVDGEDVATMTEGSSMGLTLGLPYRQGRTKAMVKVGYTRDHKRGVFSLYVRTIRGDCSHAPKGADIETGEWQEGPYADTWWFPDNGLRTSVDFVFNATEQVGCVLLKIDNLPGITGEGEQNHFAIRDITIA